MIVRDEEARLGACLESVAGIVDEMCVLDTGSADRTREVALEHGARVEEFPWCDDFARARNASIELARGDAVLVLDADEIIDEPAAAARVKLAAHVELHPGSAGRVRLENVGAAGGDSSLSLTRFFPNHADFRYEGIVHEQVLCQGRTPPRFDTGLALRHFGYAAGEVARKHKLQRNAALLERALERAPGDAYLSFQLGRTLALAEEHAAALEALGAALSEGHLAHPWSAQLYETAAYSLRALDRSSQALELLSPAAARFPDRADTCFLEALLCMDLGRLERSEAGFRRCLELPSPADGSESNADARGVAPAFNLGVMREVLGDPEQARSWYLRALSFQPRHEPSRQALERLDRSASIG